MLTYKEFMAELERKRRENWQAFFEGMFYGFASGCLAALITYLLGKLG